MNFTRTRTCPRARTHAHTHTHTHAHTRTHMHTHTHTHMHTHTGILFVTATDLGTKKKESITISNSKGRLSEAEIEKMIRDAKKFAESDRKAKSVGAISARHVKKDVERDLHM